MNPGGYFKLDWSCFLAIPKLFQAFWFRLALPCRAEQRANRGGKIVNFAREIQFNHLNNPWVSKINIWFDCFFYPKLLFHRTMILRKLFLYFCWCYFSCFFQVCRLEVNRKVICYYTSTLPPNYYGLIHRGCFRLSTIIALCAAHLQPTLPSTTYNCC